MSKTATITAARALDIMCEACQEYCVDADGSTMITDDSSTVQCMACGTTYTVPKNAFQVVCTSPCRATGAQVSPRFQSMMDRLLPDAG